jgi:tetratricopeptide (TPR) repeat protein
MDLRDAARRSLNDGRPADAVRLLSDHLAARPDDALAWDEAAEAFLRLGRPDGAVQAAQQAFALGRRADQAALLALALARSGRGGDALRLVEGLLADPPTSALAWERLGGVYEALGAPDAGIVAREQAVERAPADPGVALRLAERLERADRRGEARALAERFPCHPEADRLLVRLDHHEGRLDDAVDRARALLRRASPTGARGLWMELARIEARRGRPGDAFAAAAEGNRLALAAWTSQGGDPDHVPDLIRRLLAAELPPFPSATGPVELAFLVGFPRSGTTLVGQVLQAHPDVVTLDELPLMERAFDEVDPGLDLVERIARLPAGAEALRATWWRHARIAARRSSRLLVDKQPLNLIRVDLLARLFPDAAILVVLRDPRDAVLSAWLQDFELNGATAQCADLSRCAELYAGAFDLWRRARDRVPRAIELRYEELVTRPEEALRPVLAAMGLPWDDAVLDHASAARSAAIGTPSYRDVRQPLFDRSVGRWRAFADRLAPVLPRLQPYVDALGY